MKKPVSKKPTDTPTKTPGKSMPLPILEIVGKVSDTVSTVTNLLSEVQKTKQVVANADMEKIKAQQETERTLIKAGERHHELDNADRDSERQHQQQMAEVQLRAAQLAFERDLINQRVIKDITDTGDRLVKLRGPVRGRLE